VSIQVSSGGGGGLSTTIYTSEEMTRFLSGQQHALHDHRDLIMSIGKAAFEVEQRITGAVKAVDTRLKAVEDEQARHTAKLNRLVSAPSSSPLHYLVVQLLGQSGPGIWNISGVLMTKANVLSMVMMLLVSRQENLGPPRHPPLTAILLSLQSQTGVVTWTLYRPGLSDRYLVAINANGIRHLSRFWIDEAHMIGTKKKEIAVKEVISMLRDVFGDEARPLDFLLQSKPVFEKEPCVCVSQVCAEQETGQRLPAASSRRLSAAPPDEENWNLQTRGGVVRPARFECTQEAKKRQVSAPKGHSFLVTHSQLFVALYTDCHCSG
jgi:hypothetical protein